MPRAGSREDDAQQLTGRRLADVLGVPRAQGWLPEQPLVRRSESTELGIDDEIVGRQTSLPTTSVYRGWVGDRAPSWWTSPRAMSGSQRVTAGFVLVAVVLAALYVLHGHAAGAPASPTDTALSDTSVSSYRAAAHPSTDTSGAATAAAVTPAGSIVVDVSGRVRHPGLVTLPAGSRVADALKAAGGATHPRDVVMTDLAAKVGDGQLVVVGPAAATGASTGAVDAGSTAAAGTTSGPVDLNSADLTTLETLPGVGPVTAQKIIDWRTAHGGFSSVSQLQQVPGIGPTRFAELSPLVVS